MEEGILYCLLHDQQLFCDNPNYFYQTEKAPLYAA